MQLLVSGIVWTPLGDENFGPNPSFNKFQEDGRERNLIAFCNRIKAGKLLKIVPEYYNGVPVYYGLGIVDRPNTYIRILKSSVNLVSKFSSYSDPEYIHSWCADLKYYEYGENKQVTYAEKYGTKFFSCDDRELINYFKDYKFEEFVPESVELRKITSASMIRNPCCKYTPIYLPGIDQRQNDNLIKHHKKVKKFTRKENNIFDSIKMDRYKFKNLFGKKEQYKSTINYQMKSKQLYDITIKSGNII